MADYNPLDHSVVQAVKGTWCRYDVPDYVEALFDKILGEIGRVHWNVYQHKWGPSWHSDEVEDPEIPGIAFVRYYDGCACEDEDESGHRPDCRHSKPNFQHEDVQFRWYKYPGRGMSTNKEWTAEEWVAWFERCLQTVKVFEGDHLDSEARRQTEILRDRFRKVHPKAFEHTTPSDMAASYRRLFDAFDSINEAETPCWVCSEIGWGAGGGQFEGGPHGMIARTLHENDDPNGPCRNCGHVNSEEQQIALDTRRRKNSDASKAKWAEMMEREKKYEELEERALYERLRLKFESAPNEDAVDPLSRITTD
jgi:hypothetical protein